MKKYISISILALVLIGCTTIYQAVPTLTAVVDSAMKNWASMSVAGKTSANLDKQIVAAHDKYRAACAITQQALITYKTSGDQTAYIQALEAAKVMATGLIDLIVPLITQSEANTLRINLAKANSI